MICPAVGTALQCCQRAAAVVVVVVVAVVVLAVVLLHPCIAVVAVVAAGNILAGIVVAASVAAASAAVVAQVAVVDFSLTCRLAHHRPIYRCIRYHYEQAKVRQYQPTHRHLVLGGVPVGSTAGLDSPSFFRQVFVVGRFVS